MEIFDSPYYTINKNLLKTLGMWPYLSKKRKIISLVAYSILSISMIIPATIGVFYEWKYDVIRALENACASLYFTSCLIKFVSSYIFQDSIKLLYEQIIINWNSLHKEEELEILHKYSKRGWLLISIVTWYAVGALIVFIIMPVVPFILDILVPQDQPWQRIHLYNPYYVIIDQDKYYYHLAMTHGVAAITIGTLQIVAVDITVFVVIMHTCGMLAVVCHRLENVGKSTDYDKIHISDNIKSKEIDEEIKGICNMHQLCLENIDIIQVSFSISFFMIITGGGLVMAILGIIMLHDKNNKLKAAVAVLTYIGFTIGEFYSNWLTQQIINSSENVFKSVYNTHWYNLPDHSKKLLLLIMKRSFKPCILTACSICDLNLQTFAAIMKTSASYFTVMLSLQ